MNPFDGPVRPIQPKASAMSRDSIKTLFHPFQAGNLAAPGSDERFLFLGAEAGFARPEGFDAELACVQPLRPDFRRLEAANLSPMPVIDGDGYTGALVLCSKHRGENEDRVAEALQRVPVGGLIVIAGGKEDGIQALRKRLAQLGLEMEALPKYHGWVLWFGRPADTSALVAALASKPVTVEDRFQTTAGIFSHDRIDPGSELLAERLPTDFDGNAADLGAGWGYLSVMLAERSPRTARIDLFEADYNALEHAKHNLEDNCPKLNARFFWQDLVAEPVKEKYDLVIMNPPFHEGHAADPALGQAFVRAAAAALKTGGRLLMVANRGMPYETILAETMKEHSEVCRNARFKVLAARK